MSKAVAFVSIGLGGIAILGYLSGANPKDPSTPQVSLQQPARSEDASLASSSTSLESSSSTGVRFLPPVVDLGELPWFSKVPFVANLRNDSPDPIVIAAVRPSCGCTDVNTTVLVGLEIGPGDSCEIVGMMRTFREDGQFDRPIDVLLKSGTVHTATIRYRNRPTYTVKPETLHFGEVDLDSAGVVYQSLFVESATAKLSDPFVKSDVDWVEFSIGEQSEQRTEIIATLIKSRLRRGYEMKPFSIRTTDSQVPEYRCEVDYTGIAELAAVPPVLVIKPCGTGLIQVTRRSGNVTSLAAR